MTSTAAPHDGGRGFIEAFGCGLGRGHLHREGRRGGTMLPLATAACPRRPCLAPRPPARRVPLLVVCRPFCRATYAFIRVFCVGNISRAMDPDILMGARRCGLIKRRHTRVQPLNNGDGDASGWMGLSTRGGKRTACAAWPCICIHQRLINLDGDVSSKTGDESTGRGFIKVLLNPSNVGQGAIWRAERRGAFQHTGPLRNL
mmetsp:Transcript_6710/g.20312  ORF Transcript_6710/g.20312 Transcript_6710/m.20312 type:complete len:202 (+) Transcript_6710:791-1396(+)